jgi:hypothetical protein
VVHEFDSDPGAVAPFLTAGALTGGKPLTVYMAGLHMHTRGTQIATRIERKDGTSDCMMNVPRWNFH